MEKNIEARIVIIAGIFSLVGAVIGSGMTIFFSGYAESEKISAGIKGTVLLFSGFKKHQ